MIPATTPAGSHVRLLHPLYSPKFQDAPIAGSIGKTDGEVFPRDGGVVVVDFGTSVWWVRAGDLEIVQDVGPTCGSCRYYRRLPVDGFCQRRSPVGNSHGAAVPYADWPRTSDEDSCGDHEPGNLPGPHSRERKGA